MKAHVLEALHGLLSMPEFQKEATETEQPAALVAD